MASLILSQHATPESVLHIVNEFILIGKDQDAFEIIYSFIYSKKTKTWSQNYEKLMLVNIDLSMKFNKLDLIEDNFIIYRNISQAHNSESLQQVCKYFLEKLEDKFNELKKKNLDQEELFFEINNQNDAQSFFFNSLDTKNGQEKEDFKKTWRNIINAYKIILDLTSVNRKLRNIYITFSKKMINLLHQYKAVVDFKFFCNLMKNHQINLQNNKKKNVYSMDLRVAEINQDFLNLRMYQLDIAKSLDLNQECFQIIESINYLIFCKKTVNKYLSYYYTNLARIFLKGGFYYFHAIALRKNFSCLRKMKVDKEILKKEASKIILATLSINNKTEECFLSENLLKSYQFLLPNANLTVNFKNLYDSIKKHRIVELCDEKMKLLFNTYSDQLDIYDFSENIENAIKDLDEDYIVYENLIRENCMNVILKLLSKYFTTITFEDLKEFTHFQDFSKVKSYITMTIFDQSIRMKMNYQEKILEFTNNFINEEKVYKQYKNYVNKMEKVAYMLNSQLEEKTRQQTINDLENKFVDYVQNYEELINNRKENIIQDEEFLNSKIILVEEEEKKTDEELKNLARLKKEEEKHKDIERKLLGEKKKKIKSLIELDPKAKVLNKLLSEYNDEEIGQIDFFVFDQIEEKVKTTKDDKTINLLEKKFHMYDFYQRDVLKVYFQNLNNDFLENDVDLKKVEAEKKIYLKEKREMRSKLESAKTFIDNYELELAEENKNIFEQKMSDFKKHLKDNFMEDILKDAREAFEKEKNKPQVQRGMNSGRRDPRDGKNDFNKDKPMITKLEGRGIMFQKREEKIPSTLSRGTGGTVLSRGTGPVLSRGNGQSQRGNLSDLKRGPALSRNTGLQKGSGLSGLTRGSGMNSFKRGNVPEKTMGGLTRGSGMKSGMSSLKPGMGIQKRTENKPMMSRRGLGMKKPEEKKVENKTMMSKRGMGMKKPEEKKTTKPSTGGMTLSRRK